MCQSHAQRQRPHSVLSASSIWEDPVQSVEGSEKQNKKRRANSRGVNLAPCMATHAAVTGHIIGAHSEHACHWHSKEKFIAAPQTEQEQAKMSCQVRYSLMRLGGRGRCVATTPAVLFRTPRPARSAAQGLVAQQCTSSLATQSLSTLGPLCGSGVCWALQCTLLGSQQCSSRRTRCNVRAHIEAAPPPPPQSPRRTPPSCACSCCRFRFAYVLELGRDYFRK